MVAIFISISIVTKYYFSGDTFSDDAFLSKATLTKIAWPYGLYHYLAVGIKNSKHKISIFSVFMTAKYR